MKLKEKKLLGYEGRVRSLGKPTHAPRYKMMQSGIRVGIDFC